MRFVDQATIRVAAGKGGDGVRHFRREKFVPKGGPDGGDGGRGGDILIRAQTRSRSLLDFHHRKIHKAEDGGNGASSRKQGKSGEHLVLTVPPGTEVYDDETGELLADLVEDGQECVVAVGGNGGWGNVHFKSSTRQSPERANAGNSGEERTLRMELKLLADAALVGVPNAGKSTLIRTISAARAVVADYPFTTLTPNLGVVRRHEKVFTVADVPGLIEGAADGAGLGIQFLRHIERCSVIVYLLAADAVQTPAEQWRMLREELAAHDADLPGRPTILVLSKIDTVGPQLDEILASFKQDTSAQPILAISSATRSGIEPLLDAIAAHIGNQGIEPREEWDPLAP